mmetsp:Transcript_206/g.374  ORF Transcript_206/g.374 Transcript_206/m.374 type:complete len:415 (+) Transcript_206:1559-2803(+)
MFSLSTSMSERSSLLRPMDLAASSRSFSIHSSRLPWQLWLTSLALLRPASVSASSMSVLEGASPRVTPRTPVARLVRQLSLAASSAASAMHAPMRSPSAEAISSSRSLRTLSSGMPDASSPDTAASISFAAVMHLSLESSGQDSSKVQISSFTPSSRNSRTSESFTSPLSLPMLLPTASRMSSDPKHSFFFSSVSAPVMQSRSSSETSSAAPRRKRLRSSSSGTEPAARPDSSARAFRASVLERQASLAASVEAAAEHLRTIIMAFSPAIFRISRLSSSGVTVWFLRRSSSALTRIVQSAKLTFSSASFASRVQFSRVPSSARGAPFSSSRRSFTASGAVPVEVWKAWRHSSLLRPSRRQATSWPWASSRSSSISRAGLGGCCAATPRQSRTTASFMAAKNQRPTLKQSETPPP